MKSKSHTNAAIAATSNLSIHVRRVHEKMKSFQCPHCESAFSLKNNLKVHVRNVHEKNMQ